LSGAGHTLLHVGVDTRSDAELQHANAYMRPIVVELLHTLRGGGLPNPMVALEQLSFLLLLRYLGPTPWTSIINDFGERRFELLRADVFPAVVRKPPVGGPALAAAMRDATFAFPSPELLDLVMHRLDGLPDGEWVCADLLDATLDEVSATSSVGSPRTPTSVSNCMIELTELRAGDLVLDPAAGAGERMLSVIRRHAGVESQYARYRVMKSPHAHVQGVDPDATMVRLGALSLVFHGVEAPDIFAGNALGIPLFDAAQGFDVVLCQPPFGNRIDPSMLAPEFRELPSARSEMLFAELTLNLLGPDGRAAIVLPMSVTHSRGAAAVRLRRRLLESLRAVIMLPAGTFQPHTNVETVIVAVGRPTNRVVFIDARDPEHGDTRQSEDLLERSGAIVDDLLDEDLPVEELRAEDRDRVFVVRKDEIRDHDFSLLASVYRPAHETASVPESPLNLLREIELAQSEISRHLSELGQRLAGQASGDG
jgi:type I restriction enzyme M protein